jgi:hypothetical protein
MNATVCGDMDHGEEGKRKIAGSDEGRRLQESQGVRIDQEKQQFQLRTEMCVPSGGGMGKLRRRLRLGLVLPDVGAAADHDNH